MTIQTAVAPKIEHFDAIVVGAGMVGTALTGLLAKAGMQVALVEANESLPELNVIEQCGPLPRVSALTPVSQRLLTHLGAWPAMVTTRVTPYRYMHVWDSEGSGDIRFAADEAGTPVLGHIVENDVTLASLSKQVLTHHKVTTLLGSTVKSLDSAGQERQLTLSDDRKLATRLLVAADGANSTLRRLAGIAVSEDAMGQEAVVTTVRCEKSHAATARQAFIAGSPLAFLPLTVNGDDRFCSIVWSTTPEHAKTLTDQSPEDVGRALGRAFDDRLGEVTLVDKVYRFPLVQRHAERYVEPGFALVGDAAHSIHPLAGQGVNLGFMDAAVLAEEVINAWQRGAPWGALTILQRYERRRRLDNSAMLGLMKGFKVLFGSQVPLLTLVRNVGMSGMNRIDPLKRVIMRQATGERGRLPLSCR